MHTPYKKRLKHKADFRVKYKFRSPDEGGRKTGPPYQGIRSDISFADSDIQLYMIYPEFEDEEKKIILENDKSVPDQGTARMWISNPQTRYNIKERIQLGVKCYFSEGGNYTADCEIIEILDLNINLKIK